MGICVWLIYAEQSGPRFNIRSVFPGTRISIIKIRRSWDDRIIFIVGMHVSVWQRFCTETAPYCQHGQSRIIAYKSTCKAEHSYNMADERLVKSSGASNSYRFQLQMIYSLSIETDRLTDMWDFKSGFGRFLPHECMASLYVYQCH